MFSTKLSVSAFIQHNSADHITVGNLRIRYNPKEGNDLYIVFNETWNSDIHREIPSLLDTENRTILFKYTYTFVWGR